jgi:hypothetical protein
MAGAAAVEALTLSRASPFIDSLNPDPSEQVPILSEAENPALVSN